MSRCGRLALAAIVVLSTAGSQSLAQQELTRNVVRDPQKAVFVYQDIENFLKAAEENDLVIGSRYIAGIRITNWPLRRLILSKSAATYVRLITGMPIADPTGGFKCYRASVLKAIDLDSIMSNGYSFQIEMTHTAWMKRFRITEIPITFEDRRAGYSKMDSSIFKEAMKMVWVLALRHNFRRSPLPAEPPASG
jgi:dolichol-phosphate mannosyltransferase